MTLQDLTEALKQGMALMLTTAQVSAITAVPEGTLRWWRTIKVGPPSQKLGPKLVRYPAAGLVAWMNSLAQ